MVRSIRGVGHDQLSKWNVRQAIDSYFPEGTIPQRAPKSGKPSTDVVAPLEHYPHWPPDLFAAMAFLIEKSGAYSCWDPSGASFLKLSREAAAVGRYWRDNLLNAHQSYGYDDWVEQRKEDDNAELTANACNDELVNRWLQFRWYQLTEVHGDAIWSRPLHGGDLADWCYVALQLMIAADEASAGIGESRYSRDASGVMQPVVDKESWWAPAYFDKQLANNRERFLSEETRDMIWGQDAAALGIFESLTLRFDRGVANVLPKMRTPQVGATLRAFSHNLALLPGSQEVRTVWYQSPTAYSDDRVLNVLVLPFPYDIPTSSFVPVPRATISGGRWGSFSLDAKWLANIDEDAFADFLMEAISAGKTSIDGDVNVVVLPECALSLKHFQAAVERLSTSDCNIELLVAGLSGSAKEFEGIAKRTAKQSDRDVNVVAMARFDPPDAEVGGAGIRSSRTFYQPKHHRWRLDREQLRTYGLAARLGGSEYRWENISTDFRNVHFLPLRTHGAVVGLVCEDLARIDPCQSVVRAVGPNLVLALLMDGPQLLQRWPARYATVLADDPGSSVLTVTSAGLVTRSHKNGGRPQSHVVALWKDASGQTVPIELEPESVGMVLSLDAVAIEERTMDDRSDEKSAARYELVQVAPVHLDGKGSSLRYVP